MTEEIRCTIGGVAAVIYEHPDIGWVLADNGGAASPNCAYDDGRPAPAIVAALNGPAHAAGRPGVFDAVLAWDGWWWRVLALHTEEMSDILNAVAFYREQESLAQASFNRTSTGVYGMAAARHQYAREVSAAMEILVNAARYHGWHVARDTVSSPAGIVFVI